MSVEEHRVELGSITLNYAEGPDRGPPLVLVHGGSNRWQRFERVLDPLTEHAHVFAPDLRGHGGSTWTPGRYRHFDHAVDIETVLERVVREPAIVLGHSLGGEIALIVASERPDLVRAVIDEDGPLSADGARRAVVPTRPMLRAMREICGSSLPDVELERLVGEMPVWGMSREPARFGNLVGWDEDALAEAASTYRHNDPDMVDAVIEFEEMHAGYGDEVLAEIVCPVTILQADPSVGGVLTDDEVELALSVLSDGLSIRFDGLGHSIHMDHPERFLAAVLPLLDAFG